MRGWTRAAAATLALTACGGADDPEDYVELTDGTASARAHAMAFDGGAYAVAWASSDGGPVTDRVYFARVAPDGRAILAPTPVFDAGERIDELTLVVAGTRYALLYRRPSVSVAALEIVVFDANGDAFSPPEVLDPDVNGYDSQYAAVWAGDRLAVLAHHVDGLYIETYDTNLDPIDSQVVTTANEETEPMLAWSAAEQRLIAMWSELGDAYSVRTTIAGVPDDTPQPIHGNGEVQAAAGIAVDGDGIAAVWTEGSPFKVGLGFAASVGGGAWRDIAFLVPDNRYGWLQPSVVVHAGKAGIAWVSDVDTALPQISIGLVDLATGTALQGAAMITSGRWPYRRPALAIGANEVGISFIGSVEGADRLYFLSR